MGKWGRHDRLVLKEERVLYLKVIAIVQARMLSTRLHGKILADICGKPLLHHVIDRVQHVETIDGIIVATTIRKEDDVLEEYCKSVNIDTFRGDESDVLDRFYKSAKSCLADIVVRVTADDPFKDPEVIDRAIKLLTDNKRLDYVSNTIKPTYPEGVDIEAFTFAALERAWREAKSLSEREHVTPYIWKNQALFSTLNFEYEKDISGLRWTVDTEKDLEFTCEIYSRLYRPGKIFSMEDILRLLEREPRLKEINQGIERNLGYKRSVLGEKKR